GRRAQDGHAECERCDDRRCAMMRRELCDHGRFTMIRRDRCERFTMMRRRLGLAAIGACLGALPAAADPASTSTLGKGGEFPTTVPSFELVPQYTRTTLSNGLTLLLLEQHQVPVVNFDRLFRGGSVADPAGKEGLADVTMSLLRKGAGSRSAEELAEELDFLGASLDLDASHERCTARAQFLSKDVDTGLGLLADVVLRPKFD